MSAEFKGEFMDFVELPDGITQQRIEGVFRQLIHAVDPALLLKNAQSPNNGHIHEITYQYTGDIGRVEVMEFCRVVSILLNSYVVMLSSLGSIMKGVIDNWAHDPVFAEGILREFMGEDVRIKGAGAVRSELIRGKIQMAIRDGKIESGEIRSLEKLYNGFGIASGALSEIEMDFQKFADPSHGSALTESLLKELKQLVSEVLFNSNKVGGQNRDEVISYFNDVLANLFLRYGLKCPTFAERALLTSVALSLNAGRSDSFALETAVMAAEPMRDRLDRLDVKTRTGSAINELRAELNNVLLFLTLKLDPGLKSANPVFDTDTVN